MKLFCKRGLSMFLAMLMLVGTLSGLSFGATAQNVATSTQNTDEEIAKMQEQAVAVALAYFNKGHNVQYNGKGITAAHRFDGGDTISTNGVSPEFATPHETMYTVCSDFVHQVYWEAFKFDVLGRGAGYVATSTLSAVRDPFEYSFSDTDDPVKLQNRINNAKMLVWYHDPAVLIKEGKEPDPNITVKQEYQADVDEAIEQMFALAQPGDIFTAYSMKYNSTTGAFTDVGGHAMIWAGDVTGDGKPDIIHSGGKHMTDAYVDRREYVSENDPEYKNDLAYYGEDPKTYKGNSSFGVTTNGGSIRISDAREYIEERYVGVKRRMTLLRPALVIDYDQSEDGSVHDLDEAVRKASEYRVAHPGLTIDRTLNKTRFNSAFPGETVTLTLELTNNSDLCYKFGDYTHIGEGTEDGTDEETDGTETEDSTDSGSTETAALQSTGADATVLAAANAAEVKAALQTVVPNKPGKEAYTVTVKETAPEGAKLITPFEGAAVKDGVMTLDVSLDVGESKTLTATYEITAGLGERVVFDGGFVGDIPSNSIPIQVGGRKLTDAQKQKLAAIANGEYDSVLAAAGADNVTLAEVVYEQILGMDVLIPKHTDITGGAGKLIKAVTTPEKGKTVYQFLKKEDVSSANLPVYRTLVQNCWGGQYIWNKDIEWYEFAYNRCNDPRHIYLEPGDIVVKSDMGYKTASFDWSSYSQLVYLGEGKYLTYDITESRYLIVNDRAFYESMKRSVFYVMRPTLQPDAEMTGTQSWSLNLNDNVVINYYLADPKGMFAEGGYATVNGERVELVKEGKNWYAPVGQKAAKEMSEQSTIHLTAVDREGKPYYGTQYSVSVRDYASQMLGILNWDGFKEAKLGRAMIAMLNYGTAAQKYFKHNTGDPANSCVSAEDQARMTNYTDEKLEAIRKEVLEERKVTGNESLYYASSCVLGSSQALRFYLDLRNRSDRDALQYVVHYRSYSGKENKVTKSFTELVESNATGVFYLEVPNMAAADVRTNVTLSIEKDGAPITTVTDSIAGYCARIYKNNQDNESLKELVDETLVYGLSARDYFLTSVPVGEENELPIC